MKKIVLILILTLSLQANFKSGNDLVKNKVEYEKPENSKTISYYEVASYVNYIFGVHDSLEGVLICTPSNVTGRQIIAIVGKYIDNHPEKWNQPAQYLVVPPLMNAFPCKKKK